MFRRTALTASLAAVLAFTGAHALADGHGAKPDPAKERQTLMSNVGMATGTGAKMLKGEIEFDALAAQMVMKTLHSAALGFGYMFPEGSESGHETEAAPAIWSDRAGFDAQVAKFQADTDAKIADLDGFKAAFGAATANCGTCHKQYRIKK